MRTAVAVLSAAKRTFLNRFEERLKAHQDPLCAQQNEVHEIRQEALALCKALRLTNLPKLHPSDKVVFEEIMKDVFDDEDVAAADQNHSVRPFLVEAAERLCLEPSEEFVTKALQVWATH